MSALKQPCTSGSEIRHAAASDLGRRLVVNGVRLAILRLARNVGGDISLVSQQLGVLTGRPWITRHLQRSAAPGHSTLLRCIPYIPV